MRWLVVILLAIHGIAHLPGFTTPWKLTSSPALPYHTTVLAGLIDLGPVGARILGLAWLLVGAGFVALAVAIARSLPDWPPIALALIAVSTALTVLGLPEAKLGLMVNLGFAIAVIVGRRAGLLQTAGPLDLDTDALWSTAPAGGPGFDLAAHASSLEPVRRYQTHAIKPGTPLAGAVRLTMHGEIKLGGQWRSFTATQVIHRGRGMIWEARVPMAGVAISGSDRIVDGVGAMRWRLGGVIPVMSAAGRDVARSAAGRLVGEAIWLPAWLVDPSVEWTVADESHLTYRLELAGERVTPMLTIDPAGRVLSAQLARWGNPGGGPHRYGEFGVVVDEERDFGGYTIPSRIRAGWYYGTPRFEPDGEFIRMTIDAAEFATR